MSNLEFSYYKALQFYLTEQPLLLTDLLSVLIPRIDHSRVVRIFRVADHIPLIRSYLIAVQHVSDSHPRLALNSTEYSVAQHRGRQ